MDSKDHSYVSGEGTGGRHSRSGFPMRALWLPTGYSIGKGERDCKPHGRMNANTMSPSAASGPRRLSHQRNKHMNKGQERANLAREKGL